MELHWGHNIAVHSRTMQPNRVLFLLGIGMEVRESKIPKNAEPHIKRFFFLSFFLSFFFKLAIRSTSVHQCLVFEEFIWLHRS